jgi:hypothetical protein
MAVNKSRNPKELRREGLTSSSSPGRLTGKLTTHRGMATWGERLVPIGEFRQAVKATGRQLDESRRRLATREFLKARPDTTTLEGPFNRIVVFGGIYNNHLALEALLEDAALRGAEAVYCLGDLGGFGPNPEKIWPLLEDGEVRTIQGNYEESLSSDREDCNCGYTDPRDNHFAEISYGYTARNCSDGFKKWMGSLPARRRVRLGARELLLVHGSPRQINEFLFSSTSPDSFLEVLLDQEGCDGLLCTHTGLQWHRKLPSGRDVVNVGVVGRPANDGNPHVWYAFLEASAEDVAVKLVPLGYAHQRLAEEMRHEKLPAVFVETILTGWWTTCLEILPARERRLSRF